MKNDTDRMTIFISLQVALFFSFLFIFCQKEYPQAGAPQHLRCNYQVNPLGIDDSHPELSWVISDSRHGAVQTAYQIRIAQSEEKLRVDQADIWDSGQIISDQSIHVAYAGPVLLSAVRYYWQVRTWDKEGKPSPWSSAAWWEMGLLQQTDWLAQWIGRVEANPPKQIWPWNKWIWHPTEIGIKKPVYFRRTYNLAREQAVKTAIIKVTADNQFTLYLNGKELGNGSNGNKIFEFNVHPLLKSGKNVIAVVAMNEAGNICGFLAALKITFADSTALTISSDASWKTSDKLQVNWKEPEFIDTAWGKSREIEPWGGVIWKKVGDKIRLPRSVQMRRDFKISKPIRQARVYVTGLGSYILYLNGERIGRDLLTPGWTDYPNRLAYQTYDVTPLLKKGVNAIAALLGNAWWSSGLGGYQLAVYSEGPLRLWLQAVVKYEDGSSETLVSDKNWQIHEAPILQNSLYNGEIYDARLEQPNWNQPGFSGQGWQPASVLPSDSARLVAQEGPTIQITEELKPQVISELDSGKYVFDMGQNMVGWARLKVSGPAGSHVQLRFAEVLKKDGTIYTDNYRSAKATDVYVLKGQGTEIWEPHFTYRGFRYIEVRGYPGKPALDALTGCVFHSAAPVIGHFSCSHDLINRIQHNITWGQRGNMHSVPTDCPQRDERLGWMGDAQIFAPTACFNMEMAGFFNKWMTDISDCQDKDGAVHDVNPAIDVGVPASPAWGDAVVIIPWMVYQYYGDKRIIERNYDAMAGWVAYMKKRSKDFLYELEGYGDWVAVVPSPKKPIGTAYFYYSTRLLAEMAGVIGKKVDAQTYMALAQNIADSFNKKYLNEATHQYEGATQCANLLPLAFGITPPEHIAAVIKNVAEDVKSRNNHLSVGFLGAGYLLPMLSQNNYHDLAFQLAVQTTCPSWGYMVRKDATTIWELWDGDQQGPGMNSRNHFALGSIGRWFYDWLGGLRPDPQHPGFKRSIINPVPAGDLTWADCTLETMYGLLACKWQKTSSRFSLQITVPANTSAEVHVPTLGKTNFGIRENGQLVFNNGRSFDCKKEITFMRAESDVVIFAVGAGNYKFVLEN